MKSVVAMCAFVALSGTTRAQLFVGRSSVMTKVADVSALPAVSFTDRILLRRAGRRARSGQHGVSVQWLLHHAALHLESGLTQSPPCRCRSPAASTAWATPAASPTASPTTPRRWASTRSIIDWRRHAEGRHQRSGLSLLRARRQSGRRDALRIHRVRLADRALWRRPQCRNAAASSRAARPTARHVPRDGRRRQSGLHGRGTHPTDSFYSYDLGQARVASTCRSPNLYPSSQNGGGAWLGPVSCSTPTTYCTVGTTSLGLLAGDFVRGPSASASSGFTLTDARTSTRNARACSLMPSRTRVVPRGAVGDGRHELPVREAPNATHEHAELGRDHRMHWCLRVRLERLHGDQPRRVRESAHDRCALRSAVVDARSTLDQDHDPLNALRFDLCP